MTFKDPAEASSIYLGVYHHFEVSGSRVRMHREGKKYLEAVVARYMKEIGAQSLSYVPPPVREDKVEEEEESGVQAAMASSHLMPILYIARLCRADVVATTSFLARRVAPCSTRQVA